MTSKSRVMAIAALALAIVLPLSGCVSLFAPQVEATSTPTGETVDAALEPFYSQVLEWKPCENSMQCATAKAPLNWADPSGDSIELALIRQPATGSKRLGSLLVNPGGPGGSGYDFVANSIDRATSEKLQSSYDIVGFDPRGVNHSSAVKCYTDSKKFDEYLFGLNPGQYGSDEWLAAYEKSNKEFGQDCLKNTGKLLEYVDTESAARDLDLLRAALGDAKLNYLGFSYGTFLGATYAELFPQKTGHLVLDGAIDPATSSYDVVASQAQGFEGAMRAYLAQCLESSKCPFTGTVEEAMTSIRTLLDRLDQSPLRGSDGRELGSSTMTIAMILPLYDQSNWPYLDQLFTSVAQGDASVAFSLADSYYSRDSNGRYSDNSSEAFLAINSLDYACDGSLAALRDEEAKLEKAAPILGKQLAYGGAQCASWPFQSTREREAITAPGSADILVVGTTNDPATPYKWAVALAGELENGHLVTYKGEGHTAYNRSNSCVNNAVDNYFIDGTVPASDPKC